MGYKVNSERAVQFRKWATGVIEQFTIKAHAMSEFEKYRIVQDRPLESDFDRMLEQIETVSPPDSDKE